MEWAEVGNDSARAIARSTHRAIPGDGATHVAHERNQEMYIVQGKKMHAECLVRYEQMADVPLYLLPSYPS